MNKILQGDSLEVIKTLENESVDCVITSPDAMTLTIIENKRKKRKVSQRKTVKKEKSVSKLMHELDAVFSRFIRLSSADSEGICTCFTCGHKVPWKKIHAGHFVSRFYKATRWREENVKSQCMMCNLWRRGDPVTFREKLVNLYGDVLVEAMEASRHQINKLDKVTLAAKVSEYEQKIKELRIYF